jgi:predicted O-methyltransferase YrrM
MAAFMKARHCRVLEFGAGGSTVWFAAHGAAIVSFEHDPKWHRLVSARLKGTPNVSIHLRQVPYYPEIDPLPDRSFDIVLIDGRDRVECVRRARTKLVADGLFVVDDIKRIGTAENPGRYFEMLSLLSGWERADFRDEPPNRRGTAIFRRTRPYELVS